MSKKIKVYVSDIITNVLAHSDSYRFSKQYRDAQEKYWTKRFLEQQPPAGEKQLIICRPRQIGKMTEWVKQLRPEVKIEESDCQKQRTDLLELLQEVSDQYIMRGTHLKKKIDDTIANVKPEVIEKKHGGCWPEE